MRAQTRPHPRQPGRLAHRGLLWAGCLLPCIRRLRFAACTAGQQGRAPGRGRASQVHLVTQRGQGVAQALGQKRQATEQPLRGGHFQQHGVRGLLGDAGGELQGRKGDGPQGLALPLGVSPAQQECGLQRQGGGPPLSRAHPRLPGPDIDGRDQRTVQQNQRPVGLIGPDRGRQGLDGQGRQVHGDPAGHPLHADPVNPQAAWRRLRPEPLPAKRDVRQLPAPAPGPWATTVDARGPTTRAAAPDARQGRRPGRAA